MPLALLLFQESWRDVVGLYGYGPTLIIIAIFAFCYLKTLPDLRLRWQWANDSKKLELAVREQEAAARSADVAVRGEEARSLVMLANVLREVAVVQREATDKTAETAEMIEMLQRVNADTSNRLDRNVTSVNDRIDRVETIISNQESLKSRVGVLESHAATGLQNATA